MENFNYITLTAEEIQSALYRAKVEKAKIIQREPTRLEWGTSKFWETMAIICPEFKENNDNRQIIYQLIRYFMGDNTLIAEGISLHKGIMLAGPVGCGKTTILKVFQRLGLTAFRDCCNLIRLYSSYQDKDEFFRDYAYQKPRKEEGMLLDDFGSEDLVSEFGNKTSVTAEIIRYRYNSRLITHFTTNLTAKEIGDVYGDRIKSRLREMVNFISFDPNAADLRK